VARGGSVAPSPSFRVDGIISRRGAAKRDRLIVPSLGGNEEFMIRQTERVENNGWRFDWVSDLGDEFRGLRFYPETSILSSWSRRPHKAAKKNFHPYKINEYTWKHIRQQCIERWGGRVEIVVIEPKAKPLVKMVYYNFAFGPNWVPYEKHKDKIEANFDLWTSKGMLIEER